MLNKFNQRHNITGYLILLYITTVILICAYSLYTSHGWHTLSFGLILSICGSFVCLFVLRNWELSLQNSIESKAHFTLPADFLPSTQTPQKTDSIQYQEIETALTEAQVKHVDLIDELNKNKDALHKLELEREQFQQRINDVYQEFNIYKLSTEEELQRKTVLLVEYQETINQQREVIKKRQEQIGEFESKIRDLNYEVKTLLQLAEFEKEPPPKPIESGVLKEKKFFYDATPDHEDEESFPMPENQVKTSEDASIQLKRCIDIAQKITGANHFNNENSRFRDLSIDNFALDLRRLFDNLRSENSSTVIVYSQKESRLLFANNQAKSLLGWSVDKFIQNFQEIIQEGDQDWKKGLSQLSTSPESRIRLLMKNKSGQNLLVHCHLGLIPRGIFRHHIIGILFPA